MICVITCLVPSVVHVFLSMRDMTLLYPALWSSNHACPMTSPLQIVMIMHELINELKTPARWASRCPSCGCEMSIDNHGRRGHLYETKGTWKNYPTCFALLNVGFMIVLRRAGRYVLIWARSAVPTNLQLSSFSNIAAFRTKPEKLLQCISALPMLFSKRCCEAVW